jgi:hypothetical protein
MSRPSRPNLAALGVPPENTFTLADMPVDLDDDLQGIRITDLIRRDQVRAELVALVHVLREAEAADELLCLDVARGDVVEDAVAGHRLLHVAVDDGQLGFDVQARCVERPGNRLAVAGSGDTLKISKL